MARKPNPVKSVQITVSTTPLVHGYLSALVDTGLYGKNPAEAAERLIAKGVEVALAGGIIPRGREEIRGKSQSLRSAVYEPRASQGVVAKSASTVWLLDDDPSVLKANGRLLASADLEVERFIDPDAFLRHAEIHHPRVVVIDMWMPRMDGLEVQRRLSGISPSTRVIVLTANDDRIVRWKALAAGAAAFFIKPECGDEFLAGVRSAFAAN